KEHGVRSEGSNHLKNGTDTNNRGKRSSLMVLGLTVALSFMPLTYNACSGPAPHEPADQMSGGTGGGNPVTESQFAFSAFTFAGDINIELCVESLTFRKTIDGPPGFETVEVQIGKQVSLTSAGNFFHSAALPVGTYVSASVNLFGGCPSDANIIVSNENGRFSTNDLTKLNFEDAARVNGGGLLQFESGDLIQDLSTVMSNDQITTAVGGTVYGYLSLGTPYLGTPAAIPGLVEAENFDNGGVLAAYNDQTPSNLGGAYRTSEPVDIRAVMTVPVDPGAFEVFDFETGEWLSYSVSISSGRTYDFSARVTNRESTAAMVHIELDGSSVASFLVPPSAFPTDIVSSAIFLPAGRRNFRIVVDSGRIAIDNFQLN
ncbi:MAG TPA: carbohydrate-binding protein, partial [Bdellovibrionales bacterium]|nr:carbohydrate-binding protein [Bdellovibrionales bacterium]